MAELDEDAIDEVLYLARVNEASELESYLEQLSSQTQRSAAQLVAAAVDADSKNSALHYAAANGHSDIIKLLSSITAAPAVINAINQAGNTPLHWAALNGHLESVKLLMQSGADVTILNGAGHDAVFEAEINDKQDVVEWLLGAVDDLEKAVGRAANASLGESDEESINNGDEVRSSDKTTPTHGGTAAASAVEAVRSQMEAITTGQSAAQDE